MSEQKLRNGKPIDKVLVMDMLHGQCLVLEAERKSKLREYHALGEELMGLQNQIYVLDECIKWIEATR